MLSEWPGVLGDQKTRNLRAVHFVNYMRWDEVEAVEGLERYWKWARREGLNLRDGVFAVEVRARDDLDFVQEERRSTSNGPHLFEQQ